MEISLKSTKPDRRDQSTKSRTKTRNVSRPVVSTRDPKDHYKRPDPLQGSGLKGSMMESTSNQVQRLEAEVQQLKDQLSSAESTVKRLMKRDKDMTER